MPVLRTSRATAHCFYQQVDKDMFIHVVEKRADGIVVRGAKRPSDRFSVLP